MMERYETRNENDTRSVASEFSRTLKPGDVVALEGELGAIGRIGETTPEGAVEASLADPEEAAEFVQRTGVDCLAVAIGNAHGMYPQRPLLDFERLEAIRGEMSR